MSVCLLWSWPWAALLKPGTYLLIVLTGNPICRRQAGAEVSVVSVAVELAPRLLYLVLTFYCFPFLSFGVIIFA